MISSEELVKLQALSCWSAVSAALSNGDRDGAAAILNAETITGNHYMSRMNFKNLLATYGLLGQILAICQEPTNSMYQNCLAAKSMLDDQEFSAFRLENTAVSGMINGFVTAGVITQTQANNLTSQFVAEMISPAMSAINRTISADELGGISA